MALKPVTLTKVNVATAGTEVALASTDIYASTIIFQADEANAGRVFIGDSNVSATRGLSLDAGEMLVVSADASGRNGEEFNLRDWYVDAAQNNEDVQVTYFTRR